MIIGERLRAMRIAKGFSQGDIEHKTGLLRCYVSRVENGHTVPSLETLEKWARALEAPLYRLFVEGSDPDLSLVKVPRLQARREFGSSKEESRFLKKLQGILTRINERDRSVLLNTARAMAMRRRISPQGAP